MSGKQVLLSAVWIISLLTSCGIGRQAPALREARFSKSGDQIAYVYNVTYITSTNRTNGRTVSSGSFSNYLQLMDTKTGEKLLSKPFKSREALYILAVQGDIVWLKMYNLSKNKYQLAVYDFKKAELRWDGKTLNKNNPTLQFSKMNLFENKSGKPGIITAADNARTYLIDGITAQASLSESEKQIHFDANHITSMDRGDSTWNFGGDLRKKVILTLKHRKALQSQEDYIEPLFVVHSDSLSRDGEKVPIAYGNSCIVLSRATTNKDADWVFTLKDMDSLKTLWETTVPNPGTPSVWYSDPPQCKLIGDDLVVYSASSCQRLDMKTGKWRWQKSLL